MRIVASGILSRADRGTSRANLTFPTVAVLADGSLLATLRAGPEKDSAAEMIELYRSRDNGSTWSGPEHPFVPPTLAGKAGTLKLCYLTPLDRGRLLAAAMWVDRTSYPGQPLFNAETEGCLPMSIFLAESADDGHTWTAWRHIPIPDDIGPASLTSPILKLADGRLAMSIETNKPYLDRSKWQQRAVFLHSADGGLTWSAPATVAEDPTGRIFNWDLRCAVAPDGRVGSFAWTYDSTTATYLDIHRRISRDGGMTWTEAEAIGVSDQAARPAIFADGSTAVRVARERPKPPIVAITPNIGTGRKLSVVWGVHCVVAEDARDQDDMVDRAGSIAFRDGFVRAGQRVIIVAGVPLGIPGTTNMVRIASVGPNGDAEM